MGRFDPKYSDEQRRAVVTAIAEHGSTATEVARMAAAGELGDLDPFEVPESTARDIAAAADKEPKDDVCTETDRHIRRIEEVIGILETEAEQLIAKAKRGVALSGSDLSRLIKLIRAHGAMREELRVGRETEARATRRATGSKAATRGVVERMVQAARTEEDTTAETNGHAKA